MRGGRGDEDALGCGLEDEVCCSRRGVSEFGERIEIERGEGIGRREDRVEKDVPN